VRELATAVLFSREASSVSTQLVPPKHLLESDIFNFKFHKPCLILMGCKLPWLWGYPSGILGAEPQTQRHSCVDYGRNEDNASNTISAAKHNWEEGGHPHRSLTPNREEQSTNDGTPHPPELKELLNPDKERLVVGKFSRVPRNQIYFHAFSGRKKTHSKRRTPSSAAIVQK